MRQADRLTLARALSDPRRQASCDHDVPGLVRQRLYAIALGYEDLNDHDGLRQDVAAIPYKKPADWRVFAI